MAKPSNLVIVESPSKAKTIGKYLGPDYTVKASMGHLRDLPKSTMGVDLEHDFTPKYIPVSGKQDLIKDLKKAAEAAETVYLATDPDREGEAISWHLKELLCLPDQKARRVTFNEITQKVVRQAIENPRDIDNDLVDAQQARRVLDRIVGYELSPLLWKKVRRGLSAGRVQSVATRLVVDRENEIRAFQSKEYWSLDAALSLLDKDGKFVARYFGKGKKAELENEEQVNAVIRDVEGKTFTVDSVKRAEKKRSAAPPFTTSTLQQEASRKLGFTPKKTMMIAQQLYEGVDVEGEGTLGLITYMRTDSVSLSALAVNTAKTAIVGEYGEKYHKARQYQTKAKGAQEAHEAIRPSYMNKVTAGANNDERRLYDLIRKRAIASQMADAETDTTRVEVAMSDSPYLWVANYSVITFDGFMRVYTQSSDDELSSQLSTLNSQLSTLSQNLLCMIFGINFLNHLC